MKFKIKQKGKTPTLKNRLKSAYVYWVLKPLVKLAFNNWTFLYLWERDKMVLVAGSHLNASEFEDVIAPLAQLMQNNDAEDLIAEIKLEAQKAIHKQAKNICEFSV